MASQFYFTIDGARQGIFKPDTVVAGAPKLIGLSCSIHLSSPRDTATGQASGKRQWQPVVVTKAWGPSSPQIFQALATNEVLKTVVVEFVRPGPRGQESTYATIRLTNGTVADLRQYTDAGPPYRQLEEIAFTFQKIELHDVAGRTTFDDDWLAGA